MKTTNYMLTEEFHHSHGPYDMKTLPAGSFVRPIEIRYVPKHVLENYPLHDFTNDGFYYTSLGIIPIPHNKVRKAE